MPMPLFTVACFDLECRAYLLFGACQIDRIKGINNTNEINIEL